MSSSISSATLNFSRDSARRMVRQLHNHVAEQRQAVMECRSRAEAMSASSITRDRRVDKAEQPSLLCFAKVASEKDVQQNFIPDMPLSGISVAVSDALDVQEFYPHAGLYTPMSSHAAHAEFPLIPWLRCQGAQFVGKLSCCTPFGLSEGTVFGPEKPASVAVTENACDYVISCSLNGPPSVLCAVHHDMVGFKPTSQTFGTFTEQFELTIPSMTVGLSARRMDDLMYLWQLYTGSIDPEEYLESSAKQTQSSTSPTVGSTGASSPPSAPTDRDASSPPVTTGELKDGHSVASAAGDAPPFHAPSTTVTPHGGGPSHQQASDPAARLVQSISRWWRGQTAPEVKHPDDMPKCPRPEIPDHNPHNYTVRDRYGRIADIDVGWSDYNAEAAMADDFNQPSRPGFLRRLFTGSQEYERPQVELAVGYPAEWIDQYCRGKYTSSAEFHQRLTDAVRMHSALHYNQKLEIVPLAFDFSLEDVMEAVTIISHYQLARAFERVLAPATASAQGNEDAKSGEDNGQSGKNDDNSTVFSPEKEKQLSVVPDMESIKLSGHNAPATNWQNTFEGLPGVRGELPASLIDSIQAGQKLSIRDYHHALRVRDDVVRSTEEQFIDVDCFITPLLSDPYTSGDVRSVRPTLSFQLAGNPILSVQVDPQTPVALVGELGRDAALMEDAFCFLQFVRGASPLQSRQ
ncbi:hypothetical protein MNV84_02424 [Leishmania braziliensis]|nr:hypothetical protein MNV84_02424 [Leishmania braziliensis]